MNFRDIQGFESPRALYEFVSIKHKLHAASMDDLIRCVAEIQRRALASRNTGEETNLASLITQEVPSGTD